MKKFLVQIISFFVVAYVLLYVCDAIVSSGLRNNMSNVYKSWNEVYKGEVNADLIINGSSIAEVQISPKVVDSILHVNSFNLGMSGYSFLMQQAKYNVYLEHNKSPKIIIQIVGDGTLVKKEGLFQKTQFLPYLKDSIIENITKKYEGFTELDYQVPLFKYSDNFRTVLKGLGSFCGYEPLESDRYKGFSSNDFKWDDKFEEFVKKYPNGLKYTASQEIEDLFQKYIKTQSELGTVVFIVFPPTYYKVEKYMLSRAEFVHNYDMIAKKYNNVYFLNYSSNSQFSNKKDLFYNTNHMNSYGANFFTEYLCKDIESILRKI